MRRKKNRESAELKSSQITGRSNQVSAVAVHENPQIHEASQWPSRFTLALQAADVALCLLHDLIGC